MEKTIAVAIGDNIRELLDISHTTIAAACDKSREKHLNMVRQTLSKAIKGEVDLSITQLLDICQFFGVSLDYLVDKIPEAKEPWEIEWHFLLKKITNTSVDMPKEPMIAIEAKAWMDGYLKCQTDIIKMVEEMSKGQRD
jgi:transcriptional regulator with XRE-family HTH domain